MSMNSIWIHSMMDRVYERVLRDKTKKLFFILSFYVYIMPPILHTHSYIQAFSHPHTSTSIEEICDRRVRSWVCAPNSLHPSALTACIYFDCRWTILSFTLTYSLCPLSYLLSSSLAYINIWSRFVCVLCLNKPCNAHKYGMLKEICDMLSTITAHHPKWCRPPSTSQHLPASAWPAVICVQWCVNKRLVPPVTLHKTAQPVGRTGRRALRTLTSVLQCSLAQMLIYCACAPAWSRCLSIIQAAVYNS